MIALLLLLIPFISATFLFVAAPTRHARGIALGASLATLAIALWCWHGYNDLPITAIEADWLPDLGLRFKLGYDGVGLLMILLTTTLYPFIISAGYGEKLQHPSLVNGLLLYTQCFMLGAFLAQNAMLFYIFYELSLIPIFFLLLYWGGERRRATTIRFFMYTLAGGLALLAGIIFCLQQGTGFNGDLSTVGSLDLPIDTQVWLFWPLFLAFAIKLPIFPFHGWQPDTYTVAPLQGAMVLAAVMLKMGLYGTLKIVFPLVPEGVAFWRNTVIILSVFGALYAGVIAFRQWDLRRLIAYSSLSHVGILCAGLFAFNIHGITGSLYQAFAHGVLVVGLFYVAGALKERVGSSQIGAMGGLKIRTPRLAALFLLVMFNALALPFTQSFVGEWLMFNGLWTIGKGIALAAATTIVIGAIYVLITYQRIMLGPDKWQLEMQDASLRDHLILVPLISMTLIFGVHPAPILDLLEVPVLDMLRTISAR